MAIDGVGLWIGGGEAQHSAEMLRLLNYSIFRGQEGFLIRPQVLPLATPGAGIQLLPAPFVINSKFAGGAFQSYVDRVYSAETVATTATSVGSTRSDLVVLNCEDPYPSGGVQWPYPGASGSDARKFGPYFRLRVIENVPVNTFSVGGLPSNRTERNWSAIAVARLDRPANSNTITSDQIKPLGVVINPFQGVTLPPEILAKLAQIDDAIDDLGDAIDGVVNQRFPIPNIFTSHAYSVAGGASGQILPANTSFIQFPTEAQWQVLVPTWATYAEVFILMTGCYQRATGTLPSNPAHVYGELKVRFQLTSPSTTADGDTNPFDLDEIPGTNTASDRMGNRPVFGNISAVSIPSAMRGKKITVKQLGRMYPDPLTKGKLVADHGTNTYINITFKEGA